MQKWGVVFLFCFTIQGLNAQRITAEEYIEQYKDLAISEMKRMGVPAAITLAQGLLETESGNSELVKRSNNHFGIKCKNTWTGATVQHDDDANGECFRAYETAAESYRDHSNFLRGSTRYVSLFKLEATDYSGWAHGLKRAGYATNPRYPEILIRNIEQYNLQQYTLSAMGEMQGFDVSMLREDSSVSFQGNVSAIQDEKDSSTVVPDKILTINNSRCVMAKKGVSLLAIASKHNINLNKLLLYNEMAEDGILNKEQLIYLQRKSKTGERDNYKVQQGESLYDISQKNGIGLRYLLDYNGLEKDEVPAAGTVLVLKKEIKRPNAKSGGTSNKGVHIVIAKESLYTIAKRYKVTVKQLKEWNKLRSNDIEIGQKLKVVKK